MSALLAVLVLSLLLGGIVVLLERTHHRGAGLPRLPFGADAHCDVDLLRVRHDLDVTRPSR